MQKETNIERILVVKMFAGGYLSGNENHLGHESINLIVPDGESDYLYVYVPGNGRVDNKLKFRESEGTCLLLVTNLGDKNGLEVLAVAEFEEYLPETTNWCTKCSHYSKTEGSCDCEGGECNYERKPRAHNKGESPRNKLAEAHVRYNGVRIEDLYKEDYEGGPVRRKNSRDEEVPFTYWDYNPTFATYKVPKSKIKTPKCRLVLVAGENYNVENDTLGNQLAGDTAGKQKKLTGQAQRVYLSVDDGGATFQDLIHIIDNEAYWCKNPGEGLRSASEIRLSLDANSRPSLWELLGRSWDENSYSNVIAYLVESNNKFAELFVNDFLECNWDDDALKARKVRREVTLGAVGGEDGTDKDSKRKRLDILITSGNQYIVIENKIRSSLVKHEDGSQLDFYRDFFKGKREKEGSLTKQFILCPPYNDIRDKFDDQESLFVTKTYKELKEFLDSSGLLKGDEGGADPILVEFAKALELQSKTTSSPLRDSVEGKFVERIKKRTEASSLESDNPIA